ncbi:MAG: YdjY domain-containing protein [Planctomycetota bacterium]|nr:YdjY domain-containing protein [Planctomycetota bacterium]
MPKLLVCLSVLCLLAAAQPVVQDEGTSQDQALKLLQRAFREQGIRLDIEAKACAVPARICIREDLLEYLVVGPSGASHEALLSTEVTPSLLNTALVTLGVEPGENASWIETSPQPSAEEVAAGSATHEVIPPRGDGFYIYVAWREGEEHFLYRIEDLVGNLQTGRSLRRHPFVYLGSRMVRPDPEGEEVFAADWEGNLIALSYFQQGNTVLTAAVPECVSQTIFTPNSWLLPETRSEVMLIFSRERLAVLPPSLEDGLPVNGDSAANSDSAPAGESSERDG